MFRQKEEVSTEIIPGKKYTPKELDEIATAILKEDSKIELCRECTLKGFPTGESQSIPEGLLDEEGNELTLSFDEYKCANGHSWFPGEGKPKGIKGDNPILFEEHIMSRKRREIMVSTGTPDPSIESGMYWKMHPNGRKVNSEKQRRKSGSSFYR